MQDTPILNELLEKQRNKRTTTFVLEDRLACLQSILATKRGAIKSLEHYQKHYDEEMLKLDAGIKKVVDDLKGLDIPDKEIKFLTKL